MIKTIKVITLILVSLLIVNCEEGGGSGGGASNGTDCKTCGDYIPNEKSQLGDIAQHMIENDEHIGEWFNAVNAGNGLKAYADSQMLFGIRAYVNAKAKAVDVQGEMNVLSEDPMDAYLEAVHVADGSSRGVSQQGLCYLAADVYDSFRIDVEVVQISGATHSLAPGGNYCVLEASLPNGKVIIDPYLNRSFYGAGISWFSVSEILAAQDAGTLSEISTSPDGLANAMPGWGPLNNYYHTFEDISLNSTDREEAVRELQETTFDTINFIEYSSLR